MSSAAAPPPGRVGGVPPAQKDPSMPVMSPASQPVRPAGTPAPRSHSRRLGPLTTGNALIWGTRQVALRLEGNLGTTAALAIASSAR